MLFHQFAEVKAFWWNVPFQKFLAAVFVPGNIHKAEDSGHSPSVSLTTSVSKLQEAEFEQSSKTWESEVRAVTQHTRALSEYISSHTVPCIGEALLRFNFSFTVRCIPMLGSWAYPTAVKNCLCNLIQCCGNISHAALIAANLDRQCLYLPAFEKD